MILRKKNIKKLKMIEYKENEIMKEFYIKTIRFIVVPDHKKRQWVNICMNCNSIIRNEKNLTKHIETKSCKNNSPLKPLLRPNAVRKV